MSLLDKPKDNLNENQKQVIEAYIWIQKHNTDIPDHILNTMKNAALTAYITCPAERPVPNTERLHDSTLSDIRESFGLDPTDTSKDSQINGMSNDQLLDRWCSFQGFINWGERIRATIREIYCIEFSEQK
ncbi:MAG: hypothetical protein PHW62_00815 [Candidatus Ratteibacteria bacterium]|nr:hypothetical protein [Candidatus Ratteibacteria bacterium]